MIERVMNRVEVDDDVIMNWRPRVNSSSQLNRIPRNVIGLIVNDNSCNDLRELDLSRFEMLESIEIGSNALKNVKNVSMNGLKELKSIENLIIIHSFHSHFLVFFKLSSSILTFCNIPNRFAVTFTT